MAGNIESLKNIIEFNRSQPNADEEDIENNLCPYDDWLLKENSKGYKSCEICGRLWLGNRQVL